ncbi:uncharacterized protein BX663DRAFT_487596 [Cokeromyces recurvatus]|uniref:uncharacterized protein n=1 Tax=Cokeromyces recurvatus TaxID=90255 RepID=UPI00221F1D94|nr:uncharacterized protein BX663DRAFT_487596 [Cokeromyces recurvatus]KAI7901442.1 hypothetical protein BX663DRAFT_487596 [Cokeromyces recurvatus]
MTVHECKIVKILDKNIIFRKCKSCSKSIVRKKTNDKNVDSLDVYYCGHCKKDVDEFKVNYKLNLICINVLENTMDVFDVYDEIVESVMGCTAEELLEYLKEDARLLDKIEQQFKGLYCTLETKNRKRDQETRDQKKRVIKLKLSNDLKMIDILKKLQHEYDSSLNAIKINDLFNN